jgi:hypothetical protein
LGPFGFGDLTVAFESLVAPVRLDVRAGRVVFAGALAVVFFAAVFLLPAAVFFAADFAGVFLDVVFFAVVFLGAPFLATVLATVFFVAVFFATVFFVAFDARVVFFAAGFLEAFAEPDALVAEVFLGAIGRSTIAQRSLLSRRRRGCRERL